MLSVAYLLLNAASYDG